MKTYVVYRDDKKQILKYSIHSKTHEEISSLIVKHNESDKNLKAEIALNDDLISMIEIAEENKKTKPLNNKEANMPKVTVSKTAQNELIKIMSTKQNAKSKLNAGQLRESAKMTLESILELSPKAKAELAAALVKSV